MSCMCMWYTVVGEVIFCYNDNTMMKKKKNRVVYIFWLIFSVIMILSLIGFLLMPLLYA